MCIIPLAAGGRLMGPRPCCQAVLASRPSSQPSSGSGLWNRLARTVFPVCAPASPSTLLRPSLGLDVVANVSTAVCFTPCILHMQVHTQTSWTCKIVFKLASRPWIHYPVTLRIFCSGPSSLWTLFVQFPSEPNKDTTHRTGSGARHDNSTLSH